MCEIKFYGRRFADVRKHNLKCMVTTVYTFLPTKSKAEMLKICTTPLNVMGAY